MARRNTKTINNEFDNKLAIITGDYLLSKALRDIAKLNSIPLIEMFSDTLACMTKGEINQQMNKFKMPTIKNYIEKTEQKTARLFQTALSGAMILAGCSNLNQVNEFACNFGLAFQIRDDLINISEKSDLKPSQNDISNGIYNAPVIFAGNTSNLDEGIEKTKSLLNNYIVEADKHLKSLDNNQYTRAIRELLEILNDV